MSIILREGNVKTRIAEKTENKMFKQTMTEYKRRGSLRENSNEAKVTYPGGHLDKVKYDWFNNMKSANNVCTYGEEATIETPGANRKIIPRKHGLSHTTTNFVQGIDTYSSNNPCLQKMQCCSCSVVTVHGAYNAICNVKSIALLHQYFPQCVCSAQYGCFL